MAIVDRIWPAPAKLNLMLHITSRRPDGYHELQTVFQFLDICDELSFRVLAGGEIIRRDGPSGVAPADDLVVRAARALQAACATSMGAEISLKKILPIGAGLGGGSSDAATTLHALNHLWRLGLDSDALAEIGLQLGADVPIFVRGFAAFAEGVGERLQPVYPPQRWYLVITPDVHVSTAEIFADRELTRDCPAIKICPPSTATCDPVLDAIRDNVCAPVVVKRYPEVGRALDKLGKYAEARMSGTGASVFAGFDTKNEASSVLASMQQSGMPATWKFFVCRGCNESPLIAYMNCL
jgi:4-diphosphocytidyl-2-C-methyl-D-erythritol kinase